MIAAMTLGGRPAGVSAYLISGVVDYLSGDNSHGRLHGIETFGMGFAHFDLPVQQQLECTVRAMNAVACMRPDMRYLVAHITVSPDPRRALAIGTDATRQECRFVADRLLEELGLSDRIGFRGFHADGHSEWLGDAKGQPLEHLHHVSLIPHPASLRGIPLHRYKRRLQEARVAAERELGLEPAPTRSTAPKERQMAKYLTHDFKGQAMTGWSDFAQWLREKSLAIAATGEGRRKGGRLVALGRPEMSIGLSALGPDWKLPSLEARWGPLPSELQRGPWFEVCSKGADRGATHREPGDRVR